LSRVLLFEQKRGTFHSLNEFLNLKKLGQCDKKEEDRNYILNLSSVKTDERINHDKY